MRGCILKRVEGRELVRILESIGQGNSYVPPELAAGLLRQRSDLNGGNQHEGRPYNLTACEAQVLDCAARALTNKEIARELQISEKTVKHYMTVIMEKLQVSNRVQAILKIKGDHRSSGMATRFRSARAGKRSQGNGRLRSDSEWKSCQCP